LPGPLLKRITDDWVVARFGVQTPQFLSISATWGAIADAAWFVDKVTALAAACPPGTTGVAVHMASASRASDAPGASIVANVRKAFNEL
jgi:hypothetical protein